MKVNGIQILGEKFAYDGCHKIYIIENEKDEAEAIENEYDISPINELPKRFNNSCGLRFINSWNLKTTYVPQFEERVVFDA